MLIFFMCLQSAPLETYMLIYSVQLVYLSSMINETNQGPECRLTVWSKCDKAEKAAGKKSKTVSEKKKHHIKRMSMSSLGKSC